MLRHNAADVIGMKNNINMSATTTTAPTVKNSNVNGSHSHSHSQNHNLNSNSSSNPLDALPKQFVVSMKKLFDILDDQRTGFVKFADIEKGWHDDGCKGLPRGVMESLRKVTPTSGLLSFERFCAGLKLCLLKNQGENINIGGNNFFTASRKSSKSPVKPPRPPSAPMLEMENPLPSALWNTNLTATVRPHNIVATQRTLSMPQLSPDSEMEADLVNASVNVYNSPPPPPKPPRAAHNVAATVAVAATGTVNNAGILTTVGSVPGTNPLDKAEIRHALQNWQMSVLLNEMDAKDIRKSGYAHKDFRGCADGGSSSATDSANNIATAALHTHAKKSANGSKRRETRRHTLQNGIDYNIIKRLKQFEEEREVLLLGLDAVEKACNLYLQQLANVQEKIKYLGRMGTQEQWSEVQQERLNFQRARVFEVNRNLAALAVTWERGGFPLHFNLAIRTPSKNSATQRNTNAGLTAGTTGVGLVQSADRLRQQNRSLTTELNLKSDRIALLEREKQTLVRELYETQQRIGLNGRDTSFLATLSQSSPVCSSSSGGLGDADVVY